MVWMCPNIKCSYVEEIEKKGDCPKCGTKAKEYTSWLGEVSSLNKKKVSYQESLKPKHEFLRLQELSKLQHENLGRNDFSKVEHDDTNCSILMTTYNCRESIVESIESILKNGSNFEIVVVDNFSTDGTLEYLNSLQEKGLVKLIVTKCNRGVGRQISLEAATTEFVITRFDSDHYFFPQYNTILERFIELRNKMGDFALVCGPIISTKSFLLSIGGWKPVQWNEHSELYKRLIDLGKLYIFDAPIFEHIEDLPRTNPAFFAKNVTKLKYSYEQYRDKIKIGLSFGSVARRLWKKSLFTFPIKILILIVSYLDSLRYERYTTFKGVSYEDFFVKRLYDDELYDFSTLHPDKVIKY